MVITTTGGEVPDAGKVVVPGVGPATKLVEGTSVITTVGGEVPMPGIVVVPATGPVVNAVTGCPGTTVTMTTAGVEPLAGMVEVPGVGPVVVDVTVGAATNVMTVPISPGDTGSFVVNPVFAAVSVIVVKLGRFAALVVVATQVMTVLTPPL